MEQTKINQLAILAIGILSLLLCFFLDSSTVYQIEYGEKMECVFSFTGKLDCNYNGIIFNIELPDCQGDSYCNTIKATPVLGGLSMAFGIIVLGAFFFEDQLGQRFPKQYVRFGMIGLIGVAALLQMFIPILNIETLPSDYDLVKFTVFLEFVTLISYCTFGIWIFYEVRQKKETLLS